MDVISVVDDDLSVRLATADLLSAVGFHCEAYDSAEHYLSVGQATRAGCLILDLNMPGLSGLELQKRLVQSDHRVPVIFITAYPEERTRAEAIDAGALCYLVKPVADEELLKWVRIALAHDDAGSSPEPQGGGQ
jgi:FixJ family two-component response regulator